MLKWRISSSGRVEFHSIRMFKGSTSTRAAIPENENGISTSVRSRDDRIFHQSVTAPSLTGKQMGNNPLFSASRTCRGKQNSPSPIISHRDSFRATETQQRDLLIVLNLHKCGSSPVYLSFLTELRRKASVHSRVHNINKIIFARSTLH